MRVGTRASACGSRSSSTTTPVRIRTAGSWWWMWRSAPAPHRPISPRTRATLTGAVVANNPAMAALAQALDAGTGRQALQDVRLFSLGTGVNPAYVAGKELDWGYAQWAKPLIALMVDGMMGVAAYQSARLLQHRYFS